MVSEKHVHINARLKPQTHSLIIRVCRTFIICLRNLVMRNTPQHTRAWQQPLDQRNELSNSKIICQQILFLKLSNSKYQTLRIKQQ